MPERGVIPPCGKTRYTVKGNLSGIQFPLYQHSFTISGLILIDVSGKRGNRINCLSSPPRFSSSGCGKTDVWAWSSSARFRVAVTSMKFGAGR